LGPRLSNPADQASHKFFDPDPAPTLESETEYAVRRGRAIIRVLLVGAAAMGVAEIAAYHFDVLQFWESFVTTPLVLALVTMALVVDYEVMLMREPWKRRRVQNEYAKNILLLLGGVTSAAGLSVFLASVSSGLFRVTVDLAAGSTMICAGIYIVKRFSW
jgi:hypothetical protein